MSIESFLDNIAGLSDTFNEEKRISELERKYGVSNDLVVLSNLPIPGLQNVLHHLGYQQNRAGTELIGENTTGRYRLPHEELPLAARLRDSIEYTTDTYDLTTNHSEHHKRQNELFTNQIVLQVTDEANNEYGSWDNAVFVPALTDLVRRLQSHESHFCLPSVRHDGEISPIYHPSELAP